MGFEAEMFNSTDTFTFRKLHLRGREDLKYFQSQNELRIPLAGNNLEMTVLLLRLRREGEVRVAVTVAVTVRWPSNSQSA